MVSCSKCRGFLRVISDDGKNMALECSSCGLSHSIPTQKKEKGKADPAPMLAGMS